ncbi:MAG: F0F1 ATP synthase subunit B [Candidatus Omnitrophica bacterium]|nr:F0F1 ATP synthase subunit B [Candidatus Omnitrophota bacterium]
MPSILQLDLQQILSQALSFLLLVWVLRRFAWRPLLGMLDARRAQIARDLDAASRQRQEMEQLKQLLGRRLEAIDEEARRKIQEAIREGRRIAAEIQEEARAQAQGILSKSKETIELEVAKAKVTLRDELTDMTVGAVERLLRGKLDAKTDQQLVASILDELGSSTQTGSDPVGS